MTKTHLCNTFFEEELSLSAALPLEKLLTATPISFQLQYLPLLYRKKGERIAVSEIPSPAYLRELEDQGFPTDGFDLLEHPSSPFSLELWGASPAAKEWADQHGGQAVFPPWEIVREIDSKVFSFSAADAMPRSHLFLTIEEAKEWAASFAGPKVLKKAFGVCDGHHLRIENSLPDCALAFFDHGRPVIGEPWVERLFDFSTQWEISNAIHYLGAAVFKSGPGGADIDILAGQEERLFSEHKRALNEHIEICQPLLHKIQRMGFFGNLGIDAYVYLWEGKRKLRAVGNIYPRKTMSWAALEIQKLHFPDRILRFRYERTEKKGFLPADLGDLAFPKQLLLDFV